jgi:hypothetical protein
MIHMKHSGRHVLMRLFGLLVCGLFAYGTYKLHIVPERATPFDFWMVMGCVAGAGVFTILKQLRAFRQKRRGQS